MKIGGWKTRSVAEQHIGQTSSHYQVAPAQDVEVAYQVAEAAPTVVEFQAMFAACRKRNAPNKLEASKVVWMDEMWIFSYPGSQRARRQRSLGEGPPTEPGGLLLQTNVFITTSEYGNKNTSNTDRHG